MLSYFDLRKGTRFILEAEPFEVLEFQQMYKAQDAVVAKTKIRNLITGRVLEKTFQFQIPSYFSSQNRFNFYSFLGK